MLNIAINIYFTLPCYAGITLNAFNDPLCSKLRWHNRQVPTYKYNRYHKKHFNITVTSWQYNTIATHNSLHAFTYTTIVWYTWGHSHICKIIYGFHMYVVCSLLYMLLYYMGSKFCWVNLIYVMMSGNWISKERNTSYTWWHN